MIFLLVLYVPGFVALSYFKGFDFARDEVISILFLSFAPVGIGVVVIFLVQLLMAPVRTAEEQNRTIAGLQRRTGQTEDPLRPVRDWLLQATRRGNGLLQHLVTLSTQYAMVPTHPQSAVAVTQWTQEVYAYLSEHTPQYAADFLTPMPQAAGIFGPSVRELADAMRQRLTNLRGILRELEGDR